jgi:uncharacterized protein (DUF924 family)
MDENPDRLITDQFSHNMFRGSPQSFAHDALAQEAVSVGADKSLSQTDLF